MSRPPPRAPFGKPASAVRQDWVLALGAASSAARDAIAAADGGQVDAGSRAATVLAQLAASLRDLTGETFPVAGGGVRACAQAFLILARAFASPIGEVGAERTACAPLLLAASEHLDRLMHDLRASEARGWRSITGERDED